MKWVWCHAKFLFHWGPWVISKVMWWTLDNWKCFFLQGQMCQLYEPCHREGWEVLLLAGLSWGWGWGHTAATQYAFLKNTLPSSFFDFSAVFHHCLEKLPSMTCESHFPTQIGCWFSFDVSSPIFSSFTLCTSQRCSFLNYHCSMALYTLFLLLWKPFFFAICTLIGWLQLVIQNFVLLAPIDKFTLIS